MADVTLIIFKETPVRGEIAGVVVESYQAIVVEVGNTDVQRVPGYINHFAGVQEIVLQQLERKMCFYMSWRRHFL